MAVKLRLVRMGKKKQPTYRVVAADSRSPRDGRFLEVVGTYAPRGRSRTDDATVLTIDDDKALRWLRQGAKPTERVERLLRTSGTLDRFHGATSPGEGVSTPASTAPATAPPDGADGESSEAEVSETTDGAAGSAQ